MCAQVHNPEVMCQDDTQGSLGGASALTLAPTPRLLADGILPADTCYELALHIRSVVVCISWRETQQLRRRRYGAGGLIMRDRGVQWVPFFGPACPVEGSLV